MSEAESPHVVTGIFFLLGVNSGIALPSYETVWTSIYTLTVSKYDPTYILLCLSFVCGHAWNSLGKLSHNDWTFFSRFDVIIDYVSLYKEQAIYCWDSPYNIHKPHYSPVFLFPLVLINGYIAPFLCLPQLSLDFLPHFPLLNTLSYNLICPLYPCHHSFFQW